MIDFASSDDAIAFWLKQYGGEWTVGYVNAHNFPIWSWVDQNLKKSMAGK